MDTIAKTRSQTNIETILTLPSKSYSIGPMKIFTYPTRLSDSWQAKILEINLPIERITRPEIEISVFDGSTSSLGIEPRNSLRRVYKKFVSPVDMSGEYIFDTRHDLDGNICHVLNNISPALLAIKDRCPKVTAILSAKATTRGQETYKLLGFPVLCTDKNVNGRVIVAPWGRNGIYEGWFSSFFGDLAFEGYTKETPERIFISRRGTRGLINEAEVEQTLQEYGFTKVYFEDISIPQQWSIARNAKVIVGVHGAALASIMFNRTGIKLIELFNPGYVTELYRRMTYAIGGNWCAVTGQYPEDIIKELDYNQKPRHFALSPMRIDTTSLRMALEYLGIN
jgi:hypothetical protein